jgi:hypothetical protein
MVDEGGFVASQLKLEELTHVALAVRDIDVAVRRHSKLGIAPWSKVWDIEVPALQHGDARTMGLRAVFASAWPILYELVEATNEHSLVAEFLHRHGEGVQHFGYRVDDIDTTLASAGESGIAIDWLIADEHGTAVAFLAPDAFCGVSVELIRKNPAVSLDAWRRRDA